MPDHDEDVKLFIELVMQQKRLPIEEVFLKSGGALTSAAARGPTVMQLTGSEYSESTLLTDKPTVVKLEVPRDKWTWDGDRVVISDRVRLLLTSTMDATPAVNVSLGSAISGQTTVAMPALFDLHVNGESVPRTFVQTTHFGTWMYPESAFGFGSAKVVTDEGDEMKVHFSTDSELDEKMKSVDGLIQSKYNESWQMTEMAVLEELRNLTKPVASNPFGVNGSKYTLASAVAMRVFPYSIDTLESILKATITAEIGDAERVQSFLSCSKGMDAASFAPAVVTAISLAVNSFMPYRSDGEIVNMPGQKTAFAMHELWTHESTKSVMRTDDCEGSGANAVGKMRAIQHLGASADSDEHPFLAAAARALAHYTPAIAVLAANAGHADDADESKSSIAGHAVAVMISNLALIESIHKASAAKVKDDKGVEHAISSVSMSSKEGEFSPSMLADVQLNAIYTPEILALLPDAEAECISEGFNAVVASGMVGKLASFLVAEGTSPCTSRIYTEDAHERAGRAMYAETAARIGKSLSPNIARMWRQLDASTTGEHKFYVKMAELVLPYDTPLNTDASLRKRGDASPHFRFVRPPADGLVTRAGATPKELGTRDFAMMPLYRLDATEGSLMDVAVEEANENVMTASKETFKLTRLQTDNLSISLGAIDKFKERTPKTSNHAVHEVQWLLSYAALCNNPHGVGVFVDELSMVEGIAGEVDIHNIIDLATDVNEKDAGVVVTFNMLVPH